MHISASGGQGDLQKALTNSGADAYLSLSASLVPLFSSPLALSRNIIAASSAYTKVIIIT